jgi:catechol 2,3-dioxygenase-like lactoylglutathione lyase family enzyme
MKNNFLMTIYILLLITAITGYTPKDHNPNNATLPIEEHVAQDNYIDPGFDKLVQVAIVVKDIEAASKRWGELLGMEVPEIRTTRPGNEVDVIYRGKPSDGQVKLTFFVLGQVVIELMEPVGEGTAWKEFLDENGEGVQHLGFKVVDKVKASQALEKAGYPIIHQGRYDSDDGTYIYHDTQDALGVIVELLHSDPE